MKAYVMLLAGGMLFTGSLNTMLSKYQDEIKVRDVHGGIGGFRHPAVQSAQMFFGEFLCLLPIALFWIRRKMVEEDTDRQYREIRQADKTWWQRNASYFMFAIPAFCDATATTMLNLGLFYTQASVFQMLRGTLVFFAGLLTIAVLKRRLHSYNWLGMLLVVTGATICGYSSVHYAKIDQAGKAHDNHESSVANADSDHFSLRSDNLIDELNGFFLSGPEVKGVTGTDDEEGNRALLALFGDVLIVASQMGTALQFVLEEKYMRRYKAQPLFAVGMEGFWGGVFCILALPVLQWMSLEDSVDAWYKMTHSKELAISSVLSMLSIALVNSFGVAITKSMSGAARATIDACRTLVVWVFAMYLGWERFHWLQVSGFVVLVCGTSVYNSILKVPGLMYEEREQGLPQSRRARQSKPPTPLVGYDPLAQDHLAPLLQASNHDSASRPVASRTVPIAAPGTGTPSWQIPADDASSAAGSSLSGSSLAAGQSLSRIGTSMQWLVHSFRRPYFGSPNR